MIQDLFYNTCQIKKFLEPFLATTNST